MPIKTQVDRENNGESYYSTYKHSHTLIIIVSPYFISYLDLKVTNTSYECLISGQFTNGTYAKL